MPSILLVGEVWFKFIINNIPVCHISKHRVLDDSPNPVQTTFVVYFVCVTTVQSNVFVLCAF